MNEDFKELIQKHLPAMAAGELKNYLEQAEKDRKEFEQFKASHKNLSEELSETRNKLSILVSREDSVARRQSELDEKEKTLNQKDFNLKLEELKYQLQAEKESKNSIFQLVSTFVANPRAIEIVNKHRTYSHGQDYSPTGTTHYPVSSFENETREFKEEK